MHPKKIHCATQWKAFFTQKIKRNISKFEKASIIYEDFRVPLLGVYEKTPPLLKLTSQKTRAPMRYILDIQTLSNRPIKKCGFFDEKHLAKNQFPDIFPPSEHLTEQRPTE